MIGALEAFDKEATPFIRTGINRSMGAFRRQWTTTDVDKGIDARKSGGFGIRRAWFYDRATQRHINQLEGHFFTRSKAAFGLEVGGTRRATRGKMLALPLSEQRAKFLYGASGRILPSASNPTKAKFRKGWQFFSRQDDRGNVLLYRVIGISKKGTLTKRFSADPAYLLVNSIHQRPVLGLRKSWKRFQPEVEKRMSEAIGKALRKVGKSVA